MDHLEAVVEMVGWFETVEVVVNMSTCLMLPCLESLPIVEECMGGECRGPRRCCVGVGGLVSDCVGGGK